MNIDLGMMIDLEQNNSPTLLQLKIKMELNDNSKHVYTIWHFDSTQFCKLTKCNWYRQEVRYGKCICS